MRNINQKYKRQKNKSRYIIVLINTFQQKCQYAKSFQRKKMSNSSSSEDEGNPNSSEGQNDTEVGIGDYVLTTSHLLLCMYLFFSGGSGGGWHGHQLWKWRRWRQLNHQRQLKLWGGFHHSLQLKDQQKGKGLKDQHYPAGPSSQ